MIKSLKALIILAIVAAVTVIATLPVLAGPDPLGP